MASGDTLLEWRGIDCTPPTSNQATPDRRNNHQVLDFDASTEESTYYDGVLPRHYAGGGLTLYVHTTATSATTGDYKIGGSIERMNTDLDADSFATEQVATSTTNGTSGIITVTSITFSSGANMDSLAAGEAFRLKLARKAADVADTMTGDLEVHLLELKET